MELFTEPILDGVSAVVFVAIMGIGVAFSSIPILLYQEGIILQAWILSLVSFYHFFQ